MNIDSNAVLHFRDQLRDARATALRDAEAFEEIVFVLERLGIHLTGKVENLGKYKPAVVQFAKRSPLAMEIPDITKEWHTSFEGLYDIVRNGRNDALHEGACARHLTACAVELAIVLEDALMYEAARVRDFMVRSPVTASMWQAISSIRQTMLSNSFSYLPVSLADGSDTQWQLVSDLSVAQFLRSAERPSDRNKRLACKLREAVQDGSIRLIQAKKCKPDDLATDVLKISDGLPILVVSNDLNELRGIMTPFDLL